MLKSNINIMNKCIQVQAMAENFAKKLSDLATNGPVKDLDFEIDCSLLSEDKHLKHDIRKSEEFSYIFSTLKKYEDHPCIYWFYSEEKLNSKSITEAIKKIQDKIRIPAINPKTDDSNCLYVGKATKCVWGRLIQHLGVHINQGSHGLNLMYWAKDLELKLHYHVVVFPKDTEDNNDWKSIIRLFEYAISTKSQLNPIIGKHDI